MPQREVNIDKLKSSASASGTKRLIGKQDRTKGRLLRNAYLHSEQNIKEEDAGHERIPATNPNKKEQKSPLNHEETKI